MDAFTDALLLGFVEGITEFLPVSSTGHLILANEVLGRTGTETKTFDIFIQLGAVLAVLWDRRTSLDLRKAPFWRLAWLIALAFAPAAVAGFAAHGFIKARLFSGTVVAVSLIVGAVAILVIESRRLRVTVESLEHLRPRHALAVGLAQCLALVPGVSRAAATILGGMLAGLGRPVATEFSFLLAIPTMGAATAYDLLKTRGELAASDVPFFATGFVVSFVVALATVRWLLAYVRRHDFRPFAWWRLVVGATFFLLR